MLFEQPAVRAAVSSRSLVDRINPRTRVDFLKSPRRAATCPTIITAKPPAEHTRCDDAPEVNDEQGAKGDNTFARALFDNASMRHTLQSKAPR